MAALAVAFASAAWLLLARGGDYTVTAVVDDAGQLVSGNEVQIGGVPVGKVAEIRVRDSDHLAELKLELDSEAAPLHEGTTATIRNPSLTSVAGRYIALTPGPNDAPEIPDGGEIPTEDTTEIVDLDQVLNSLDPRTVAALSQVVRGSTAASRGRGEQLGAAIDSLNPALSRTAVALDELTRDQESLERLVVSTSGVVAELAGRRNDLSEGTGAAAQALDALASEREVLAQTLSTAPSMLRTATPALADVRALLGDLEPAVSEARPVARGLSRLLPRLRPASAGLRKVLPPLRSTLARDGADDDLGDLVGRLPAVGDVGVPLSADLTEITEQARPILGELRPYIPDLTSGIVAGFGGSSGGYYDANGHYARISFHGGPFSLVGLSGLMGDFGAIRQGATDRCPGGAGYRAADGSNPFVEPGVECDPGLTEEGP